MVLTDTHTHLYATQLQPDLDEVIQRALDHGVERFFLPNIDKDSIGPMMDLVQRDPNRFFPMMGLHPCSVNAQYKEELKRVKTLLDKGGFCAVGEIGIDLYWDKTFVAEQTGAFATQVNWAKELGLPIVIHARESFDEIFAVVDQLNDDRLTGIFHCFTGTLEQAEKIIAYGGFKLGIGGVLTFKKAGLDKTLKDIDLRHLVLETDSPYLAPTPFRGKRNESSYLLHVAQKLADVHTDHFRGSGPGYHRKQSGNLQTIMEQASVLIIYTGGTIGMVESPTSKHLVPFDFENLKRQVPELNKFNIHLEGLLV